MAHIILTGATGLVGSGILAKAMTDPSISRISILSRRPVTLAQSSPKVKVLLHEDFTTYNQDTLAELSGASACIWALGTSALGMAEEEYTRITCDYTLAAASAFAGLKREGGGFNFVFVSGEGANVEGKGQLFARVKGRTEKALLKLDRDGFNVYNVRPGLISPRGKLLAQREEKFMDRVSVFFGGVMSVVYKSMQIYTDTLGEATIKLALGDGKPWPAGNGVEMDGRLIRNTALRSIGGA